MCRKDVMIKPTKPNAIIDKKCILGATKTIIIKGNVAKNDLKGTVSITWQFKHFLLFKGPKPSFLQIENASLLQLGQIRLLTNIPVHITAYYIAKLRDNILLLRRFKFNKEE